MVTQSQSRDPRQWAKWRNSRAVGTIEDAYNKLREQYKKRIYALRSTGDRSMTYIDEFLKAGIDRIGIFIWNHYQRVPAQDYVTENQKGRKGDIAILVDTNPDIMTGEMHNGRMAIRYNSA